MLWFVCLSLEQNSLLWAQGYRALNWRRRAPAGATGCLLVLEGVTFACVTTTMQWGWRKLGNALHLWVDLMCWVHINLYRSWPWSYGPRPSAAWRDNPGFVDHMQQGGLTGLWWCSMEEVPGLLYVIEGMVLSVRQVFLIFCYAFQGWSFLCPGILFGLVLAYCLCFLFVFVKPSQNVIIGYSRTHGLFCGFQRKHQHFAQYT